jgi:hypothetical protein
LVGIGITIGWEGGVLRERRGQSNKSGSVEARIGIGKSFDSVGLWHGGRGDEMRERETWRERGG